MELTVPSGAPAPPAAAQPTESGGSSAALALAAAERTACALEVSRGTCSAAEDAFAREFVLWGNATKAYIIAHPGIEERVRRHVIRNMAWEMSNRPRVLARIREYESAAARATVIDVQAILENDRRIVEGFQHADKITQYLRVCCRYCYGVEHQWQWIDFPEYLAALSKAEQENEERVARKQKARQLPDDAGGYGYDAQAEPNVTCPKCEGMGTERVIFADTTKLEGPARAIVKGVKVTANGTEILLHDVDKAKERLLRAAGAFGDDAASVARGAAAGAAAGSAAGAAAAQRLAERAKAMTPDEARRAYLSLVTGGT